MRRLQQLVANSLLICLKLEIEIERDTLVDLSLCLLIVAAPIIGSRRRCSDAADGDKDQQALYDQDSDVQLHATHSTL